MSVFVDALVSSTGRISRSVYGWAVAALIVFNETINPIFTAALRGKEKLQNAIVEDATSGLSELPSDLPTPETQSELAGAMATTIATDTGLNGLLGFLLLGMTFILIRTFYVLAKKRICDIGLPVAFVLVPVGLFFTKQILLNGTPDYLWWMANIAFIISFLGLAFVPGQRGENKHGGPPEAVWPETVLSHDHRITLANAAPDVRMKSKGAPRAQFGQRK